MFLETLLILMGIVVILLSILLIVTLRNGSISGEGLVTVLVLGDIGRSPRMQYHSISFAKHGYQTQYVGYEGSKPHQDVVKNSNIAIFYVQDTPEFHKYMPKLLAYGFKVIWQSVALLWKLCQTKKSAHLLMQTPPAIPTLAVAWLFCLFRCTRLLIDWHNYGYSILALSNGRNHPLISFSRWYEQFFGQLAFWSFCVTEAMQKDLNLNWNICRTEVLYDRPPEMFKAITIETKHDLFKRLSRNVSLFKGDKGDTIFTQTGVDGVTMRADRPALLVSSTSWTEDEDFSILIKALEDYEEEISNGNSQRLPNLICVITGKGPQKEYYKSVLAKKDWAHIQVCTPWLEAEDYPLLLASADLGACLHTSSSGLDLPMKIVDMFGCGLPVCAVNFKCISELVQHGRNGLIFDSPKELTSHITALLSGFPGNQEKLNAFRENLKEFQELPWEKNWDQVVLPVMNR